MTAADKYYLKAKDNYPYDFDEVMEALEYGLSNDNEHPGLLTLKGTIYFADLKQFEAARECFQLALYSDPGFVDAYDAYIDFSLVTGDLQLAEKLVNTALQQRGIDKAAIFYKQALLKEKEHKYDEAMQSLQKAKQNCTSAKCYSFYDEESERVQLKEKQRRVRQLPVNIILR